MGVGRLEETLIDKLHQRRQSLARGCRKAWEGYHRNDENARLKINDLLNGMDRCSWHECCLEAIVQDRLA